jgi:hypothetical protein
MLEKMHGTSFDWLTWRGEGVIRLGVVQREAIIIANADILRKYAIGYCPAEEVICRPKKDCTAVMFLKDNDMFWTHLTNKEFNIIFPREK